MAGRKQLRLWQEEQSVGEDPLGTIELEWRSEDAAAPEIERPILEEAERWLLAAYVRGDVRKLPPRRNASVPASNQLNLRFPPSNND